MLQSIREHTQGWIAGIIISIVILTFALWGIHSYFVSETNNRVVAEVNGVSVTKEQLAIAYERLRRQMQIQLGSNSTVNTKDESVLKSKAIQALTEIEALKQASTNHGFSISNRQVDNYLESMPDFQVDGQFSIDRFQEILSSTLLSSGEFLDLIRTSLLIDQPKLGIIFTSFSLPDEVTYTFSLVNQERNIEYISIPFQYFLTNPNNAVTTAQIQAYYNQHQQDFMTPEQVNVEYVELSFKDLLAAAINPTETLLKNFYNENINAYTQPMAWRLTSLLIPLSSHATNEELGQAEKKLEEINQALSKGEAFNQVAHLYPDKTFPDRPITHEQVPAELQKAVSSLSTANPLTVIRTKQGFVVIKLMEVTEPHIQAFDLVKNKVKETYTRQHAEEKFAELREKLANLTYEHPDSLQSAAKALNLPIKTSELFTKDKGGKDISQYKKVREVTFSNDVLNLQNNSDIIQLHPESFIVLRVKSHIASALLPLKSISAQIEEKIKLDQAKLQAEKFANEIKAKLESGVNPDQLAAVSHLTWNKPGYLGRYSTKVDSAILDMAFRLPNPADLKSKTVYGATRLPNGYAVVALRSLKEASITDDRQYAIFSEQVQNSEGLLEYELYKQNELHSATIKLL